jgi:hypothetical protein
VNAEKREESAEQDDPEAIAAIEALGGKAERDYWDEKGPVRRVSFALSRRMLKEEEVAELAEHVKRLPHVVSLSLYSSSVSGPGLAPIGELTGLQSLGIGELDMTDDHLRSLSNLENLVSLSCESWEQVTDEGLQHLGQIRSLKAVRLSNSGVTDAGLEHLSGLHQMGVLFLEGTVVEGPGFVHLKTLPNLGELFLSGSKFSDDGLAHVAESPDLSSLHLNGTAVTDRGLEHLSRTPQLRRLSLNETNVPDLGIEHL